MSADEQTSRCLDWSHLPEHADEVSLWDCLHDGRLVGVESNARGGTLRLRFRVWHINNHQGLPDGLELRLDLAGVRSVRAARFVLWPCPDPAAAGSVPQEQPSPEAEDQTRAREESVSWARFEEDVNAQELDTMDASLAAIPGNVALRLEGYTLDDDTYYTVTVGAESLAISRSDGPSLTLGELLRMGEEYWSSFASRSEAPAEGMISSTADGGEPA